MIKPLPMIRVRSSMHKNALKNPAIMFSLKRSCIPLPVFQEIDRPISASHRVKWTNQKLLTYNHCIGYHAKVTRTIRNLLQ